MEEIEEILRFFAKKKVIEVRKNGPPEKIEEILRFFAKKKVLGWRKLRKFGDFFLKKRYWGGGNP